MTTDMYPKVRSRTLPGLPGRIVGIAKGAGMIEPGAGAAAGGGRE